MKMSSLLENFEQQYAILTADITSKIGRINSSPDDHGILNNDIEKSIEEVQELLEQMELEVHEAQHSSRSRLKMRVDSYRAELGRLQKEWKKMQTPIYHDGNYNDDIVPGVLDQEQRLRLLENSETIDRTGQNINSGYRIILETEEIGTQVLQDLYSQRETIQKSRQRVKDVNEEVIKSSRTLSRMIMSSVKNRLILFLISLVFIILIVSFLVYSFNKHFH